MLRLLPITTNWRARSGVLMWSHLLALACALLLLPAQAVAGAKEKLAALAPSGLVLVMDEKGKELVVQNADKPFVPSGIVLDGSYYPRDIRIPGIEDTDE